VITSTENAKRKNIPIDRLATEGYYLPHLILKYLDAEMSFSMVGECK